MFASCAIRPARCARVSPMPTMPPQHTEMPAPRTRSSVSRRSLVIARRDDLAVELGRGVEIVVVVVEAGVLQRSAWPSFSMPSVQHVSRPSAFTARTIVEHRARVARPSGRATRRPCRSASRRRPSPRARPRPPRRRRAAPRRHAGVIARGLRAVAAILGAAAGLDRHQRRELHRIGRMVRAMHLLRAAARDRRTAVRTALRSRRHPRQRWSLAAATRRQCRSSRSAPGIGGGRDADEQHPRRPNGRWRADPRWLSIDGAVEAASREWRSTCRIGCQWHERTIARCQTLARRNLTA